jgi:hypothetical protein
MSLYFLFIKKLVHFYCSIYFPVFSQKSIPPYSCARIYRPSFHENKPKTLVSVIQNAHFGLVFTKTGSINLGTELLKRLQIRAQARQVT